MRLLLGCGLMLLTASSPLAADVLIVADEFPAMQVLARQMKTLEGFDSRIVAQTNLPSDLTPFSAVVVYIHGHLRAAAEKAFISYTEAGGKLVALHHSVSSGKKTNENWFGFLGVDLPKKTVEQGGYKWIEGVTLEIVKRADHFITTNRVAYPNRLAYAPSAGPDAPAESPGFTLHETEVYLNHVLTRPRTVLLGFKYLDAKTGQTWMQDRAGWLMPAGRGWIFYFMPGHSARDFENKSYARLVLNALVFQPGKP